MMLDFGFIYALGTMFLPMVEKFQESRMKVAAVQSTFNGVAFISSVLTGLIVSKFGCHKGILVSSIFIPGGFFLSYFAKSIVHLYFTLSVLAGLGISFVYVSCITAVGKSFPVTQRSTALSVQMALMGLTSVIYPYLIEWLLSLYGVSGVFLVLSGVFLHTIITFAIFRYEINIVEQRQTEKIITQRVVVKSTEVKGKTRDNNPSMPHDYFLNNKPKLEQKLCSASLCLFAIGSAMLTSNTSGFITIAQDLFTDRFFSDAQILSVFMAFNICNAVGRLGPGITYKLKISSFLIPLIASVLGLSGQVTILLAQSYIPALVGSGLTGVALGSVSSAAGTIMFELFGPERQAIGLGISATLDGIFITGIGPVFGSIRDTTGTYHFVLILTISLNIVSFLLFAANLCVVRVQKKVPNVEKYYQTH